MQSLLAAGGPFPYFDAVKRQSIAVVIPVYRHNGRLQDVLAGILEHIPLEHVLVVDDGGPEQAAETALELGAHVLRLPRNRGKGAALRVGIDWWRRQGVAWVITLDADGQHDPADLPEFIRAVEQHNADTIVGWRHDRSAMPWDRRLSNLLTSRIVSIITGQRIHDSQCGYRALRTELLAGHRWYEDGFAFESEWLLTQAAAGGRIEYIPIRTIYHRGEGGSMRRLPDTLRFIRLVLRRMWTRD